MQVAVITSRDDLQDDRLPWDRVLLARDARELLGFTLTGVDTTRYAPPFEAEAAVFMSSPV